MRMYCYVLVTVCVFFSVSCSTSCITPTPTPTPIPDGYKDCFGNHVPIEYVTKKPISKSLANSVRIGEEMQKVITRLGIPSQDSGDDSYIWHYKVEGGTYLLVVGKDKVEEARQYSNKDIK